MIYGAVRKTTLTLAAIIMMFGSGIFAAGSASAAGPYPQAKISRTLFINPSDYTTSPAWVPPDKPGKLYLTAGTYYWIVDVGTTWSGQGTLSAFRWIYLKSDWYYWRCYVNTVMEDPATDTTGAQNYCYLAPTDGSSPTAYLTDTIADSPDSLWDLWGAGDYSWFSTLDWESNP